MISKKLLSEVLEKDTTDGVLNRDNKIKYALVKVIDGKFHSYISDDSYINIHELAYKCKEWAYNNNFIIVTLPCLSSKWSWRLHGDDISDDIDYDTEPEAIFKACQWILDNK